MYTVYVADNGSLVQHDRFDDRTPESVYRDLASDCESGPLKAIPIYNSGGYPVGSVVIGNRSKDDDTTQIHAIILTEGYTLGDED